MIQLLKLKLMLGITGAEDDDVLLLLLDEARAYILGYTGRRPEQWLADFDAIQRKMAAVDYNRMGAEGYKSRSEGGVSTSFSDGYPAGLVGALNRYRLAKGLR